MYTLPKLYFKLGQKLLGIMSKWIDQSPLLFALSLVILGIVSVGSVFLLLNSGWAALVNFVTPKVTVVDAPTLVSSIKPLGQFVTVSYQLATVDNKVDIRSGILDACNQWGKYAFIVEVQAGTDLSTLQASDVSYDAASQTYTVSLPKPSLTSCNVYDKEAYRYENFAPRVGCPLYEEDFTRIGKYQVIQKMRDKALHEGILDDAKRENEQTLEGFFKTITKSNVVLNYKEDEPKQPLTCYPDPPAGWTSYPDPDGSLFWRKAG